MTDWIDILEEQIRDFPISTLNDVLKRLCNEFSHGGFTELRAQRVREAYMKFTALINDMDEWDSKRGEAG